MKTNELRAALDDGAVKRYLAEQTKSGPFRMSAAGDCARKLALLAGGAEPEPVTAGQVRIFGHGSLRGRELALDLAAGLGPEWTARTEVEVSLMVAGVTVLGHLDVLLIGPDERRIVVEYKTMNEWAWKRVSESDPLSISEHYRAQGALYAVAAEASELHFVCESKNDGKHKIVSIPPEQVLKDERFARLNLATAILAHRVREIPDPLPADGSGSLPWRCNYCSVWQTCVAARDERVVDKGTAGKRKLVLA